MTDTEKTALERRIYDRCLVRVGQLEAEKAALERRIDELCAEVERLRQIACGAANEADRLTHDAAALQIENAKLREYAAKAWGLFIRHGAVHACDLSEVDAVRDGLRELGIEVD